MIEGATRVTLALIGVATLACGCEPVRELVLVPALPTSCATASVGDLRVRGLGDFAPSPGQVTSLASAGAGGLAKLELPRGTRVVTIEGEAADGLAAFGRTAPLELPTAWTEGGDVHRLPITYGAPDAFCATANLAYARGGHRATLLNDGSVLLSGGVDQAKNAVTALERYLPGGDATQAVAMFAPVGIGLGAATIDPGSALGHSATLLADGRVLIAGGAPAIDGEASGIAFAEVQVLTADGHTQGGPQILGGGPRAFHAATRLPDGRILVTGGCAITEAGACKADQTLGSVVLYDPTTSTWASGIPLLVARAFHDAFVRDDGMVVIIGGRGEGGVTLPPELYDPAESRGATIAGPNGTAVTLPGGLIVALNDGAGPSARSVAWSARDEAPTLLPQLSTERTGATLTALEDGAVLIAGGASIPSSALLTLDGPTRELPGFGGQGHTATLLRDGSVLIAGGLDGAGHGLPQAAVFLRSLVGPFDTPSTLTFDDAPRMIPNRPSTATIVDGALALDAGVGDGRFPQLFALLAGPQWAGPAAAGFELSALVGRDGDGVPAILFGDPGQGRYVAVTFAVGAPPRLLLVSRDRPGLLTSDELTGCEVLTPTAAELPDAGLAPWTLRARNGHLELDAAARTLLRCAADARVPTRGAIAVGAISGRVRWDNLAVER